MKAENKFRRCNPRIGWAGYRDGPINANHLVNVGRLTNQRVKCILLKSHGAMILVCFVVLYYWEKFAEHNLVVMVFLKKWQKKLLYFVFSIFVEVETIDILNTLFKYNNIILIILGIISRGVSYLFNTLFVQHI